MFYSARMAQRAAEEERLRLGVASTIPSSPRRPSSTRYARAWGGVSPEQVAATRPGLGLSALIIYCWVAAGYAEMTNLDLRQSGGMQAEEEVGAQGGAHEAEPGEDGGAGAVGGGFRELEARRTVIEGGQLRGALGD